MTTKPVIYISSTFFDLQEHRRVLIDALRSAKVFDVRGMENYGTISQPPLKVCLDDVEKSEFYILLLGKRYGFIPIGSELSITNLEFNKALVDDLKQEDGSPAINKRCVLPFIADESYTTDDAILKAIQDEREKDGEATTTLKDKNLQHLKNKIGNDFVIDKKFTSPTDLVSKVLGALIPELVGRKYASVVSSIKMQEELAYRCNRVRPRDEFLMKNSRMFRTFVIHGERCELPEIFANNILHYDLNIDRQVEIKNLDAYASSVPEKFISGLAVTFHQRIFSTYPDTDDFNFEQLIKKVITDPGFSNMVIRIEISLESWKKYYSLIELLFAQMNKMGPLVSKDKNVYLILIVKYKLPENDLDESPAAAAILNKLQRITTADIEEWVETYFYMSKGIADKNHKDFLAKGIIDYYFKDYAEDDLSFPMQDAIEILKKVVNDFNGNRNMFENYQKIYS